MRLDTPFWPLWTPVHECIHTQTDMQINISKIKSYIPVEDLVDDTDLEFFSSMPIIHKYGLLCVPQFLNVLSLCLYF